MAEPFKYPTPEVTQMVAFGVTEGEFTEDQLYKVFDLAYRAAGIGHRDGWSAAVEKARTQRFAKTPDPLNGSET